MAYEITFSEFNNGWALEISNDYHGDILSRTASKIYANQPHKRRYFDSERVEEKGYLAGEVEAFKAETGIQQISRSLADLLKEVEAL
jgi:hypothetical protein